MTLPEFPSDDLPYPETSQATTVLVLGIVGIVVPIVAPVAWILANQELRAIEEGRRDPSNASTANTGKILGIVGTALFVLGLLAAALGIYLFLTGSGFFGSVN